MHADRRQAREWRLRLPRDPAAAAEARRLVGGLLDGQHVSAQVVENARLISSELVTNAYRHGEGEIELRVRVLDQRVRIEVIDAGTRQAPAVRARAGDETGGWGLRIVDHLALQWGVLQGTAHVWADLGLA